MVWGVLIFAFGFEGVASLIHGEWWQTFFGFGGMLGLTAMLVYWTRIQKLKDIRWLVAASMVALIVVALSPYIEQQRWPFTVPRPPMPLLPPNSTMATGPDGKRYVVTAAAPFTRLKFLIREGQDPQELEKINVDHWSMIPITAVLNGQETFIGYYVTLFFHGFAATNYKRVFSPNVSGLKLAYKDVWMTGAVVTIDGKATVRLSKSRLVKALFEQGTITSMAQIAPIAPSLSRWHRSG